MTTIKLTAIVTCPHCHHQQKAKMPTDYCQYFLECKHCGEMIRAEEGSCCVFCTHADTKCPPQQKAMMIEGRS